MPATWPSSLPQQFLQQGFKEPAPDVAIRTSMDAGPPKVRRRFLSVTTPITASISLSFDQSQDLMDFYNNDLEGGTLTFNMPNPRTGDVEEYRFRGPVELSADGARFFALLPLEKMP